MNPSIVPLLSISITPISFSKDSLLIQVITLYPFSSATFSIPLKTLAKKEFKILGIITPIVLVDRFLRFNPILFGLYFLSLAYSLTLIFVGSLISGLSFNAFDTVDTETPNSLAICFKVAFDFILQIN